MFRSTCNVCALTALVVLLSPIAYGAPVFTELLVDAQTHGTASVQGALIDGDAHLDIVGAVIEDNDVVWWHNDGSDPPNWTKHTIDTDLSGARSIYAKDINNDGRTDVVAASYDGHRVVWYRNEGGSPVRWSRYYVNTFLYDYPHEVCADDINMDGHIDIVATSSSLHEVTVWFSDGADPPHWTKQTVRSGFGMGKSVRTADMNQDGKPDIIAAALLDNDVMWFRNSGTSPIGWEPVVIDTNFYGAHRVDVQDMDNDQDLDVIGAAYQGHLVSWWENMDGQGRFWLRHDVGDGVLKACVAAAGLLDDDDIMDIAATGQQSSEVSVWTRDSVATHAWNKQKVDDNFNRVWPLDICDINGDGRLDIVAASGHTGCNRVQWYRNESVTAVESVPVMQGKLQISPNPFNPLTSIDFELQETALVNLEVFDTRGLRVAQLLHEELTAGEHSVVFDGADMASGVYYARLTTADGQITNSMVLVK